MITLFKGLQDVEESISIAPAKSGKEKKGAKQEDERAQWLTLLSEKVSNFLTMLPEPLKLMQRTANLITNPLFRFLEREVITGHKLLEQVRSDL